jgi:hypothetical protein
MPEKSERQSELLRKLRALPIEASAELLLAVHRAKVLGEDVLTRALGADAVQLLREARSSAGDIIFELVRLKVRELELLINFWGKVSAATYTCLRRRLAQQPAEIFLAGTIGGAALGKLVIENTSRVRQTLLLSMKAVGAPPHLPANDFHYHPKYVGGGEIRDIAIAVVLRPDVVNPGKYRGRLKIRLGSVAPSRLPVTLIARAPSPLGEP